MYVCMLIRIIRHLFDTIISCCEQQRVLWWVDVHYIGQTVMNEMLDMLPLGFFIYLFIYYKNTFLIIHRLHLHQYSRMYTLVIEDPLGYSIQVCSMLASCKKLCIPCMFIYMNGLLNVNGRQPDDELKENKFSWLSRCRNLEVLSLFSITPSSCFIPFNNVEYCIAVGYNKSSIHSAYLQIGIYIEAYHSLQTPAAA